MAGPNWKTRLAVMVNDGGGPVLVTPIDSFSPSFALTAEPLHSLQATHLGVVYSPQSITFSMTVKAIGDSAAKLTILALNGTRFAVTLQEAPNSGDDWSFNTIVLSDCIITSATPTAATIAGAPVATFSGFSLGASADPKPGGGTKAGIP